MQARAFWLAFLRFCTLLFSLATLACHIANIVLLNQYASGREMGSWWPKYVPYILYFVGPGVSTLCALALNFISISSVQSIRGDRLMAVINIALMIAVIVYNTLESGVVPWTDNTAQGPSSVSKGFASYCSVYNPDNLTFTRCWLSNGMWLGVLIIAVFWIILGIFVVTQTRSDIYDDDYDNYNFKDDVPMATTFPPLHNDGSASGSPGHFHASSPAVPSPPPSNAQAGQDPSGYYAQTAYPNYDNYYDYPPQSPYGGYNAASSGAYGGYGNYSDGSAPVQGAYPLRQDDTVHIMSDIGGDQSHSQTQPQSQAKRQQYYSPTSGAAASPTTQTPNAY